MKSNAVYERGQMVGGTPYRVVRFLGGGGMGSVYEVEDTSIGKRYVLKTLHGDLAHRADLAEMLRQEARLLARVKHKHIVDVITAGRTSDAHALPYIVMEKLDGVTLKGLLQTHTLPWQFVRQIANELLEALYRMHHPGDGRRPMIHRDIKPENIFLAKDDDGKYITKLLDLGIASWLDGQQQRGFHGTLKYAAPEQLCSEPLTERTDLYQAALVFFEMLTGCHPFAAARTEEEVIAAALLKAPPRVSDFVGVPKGVDDVIFAALSKHPQERPRDAYQFMMALQDLREEPASRAALSRTTMVDLRTAIAKRAERGYEAYATAPASTLTRPWSGGLDAQTIREASPSFAVAATDEARAERDATAPIVPTLREAGGGVDRAALTRSQHPAPRRRANGDTEDLLLGLAPSEFVAGAAAHRKSAPGPLAGDRGSSRSHARASQRRVDHKDVLFLSEAGVATPLAAEVEMSPVERTSSRAWVVSLAAVVLLAACAGVVHVVYRAPRASGAAQVRVEARAPSRSEVAQAPAPSVPTSVATSTTHASTGLTLAPVPRSAGVESASPDEASSPSTLASARSGAPGASKPASAVAPASSAARHNRGVAKPSATNARASDSPPPPIPSEEDFMRSL